MPLTEIKHTSLFTLRFVLTKGGTVRDKIAGQASPMRGILLQQTSRTTEDATKNINTKYRSQRLRRICSQPIAKDDITGISPSSRSKSDTVLLIAAVNEEIGSSKKQQPIALSTQVPGVISKNKNYRHDGDDRTGMDFRTGSIKSTTKWDRSKMDRPGGNGEFDEDALRRRLDGLAKRYHYSSITDPRHRSEGRSTSKPGMACSVTVSRDDLQPTDTGSGVNRRETECNNSPISLLLHEQGQTQGTKIIERPSISLPSHERAESIISSKGGQSRPPGSHSCTPSGPHFSCRDDYGISVRCNKGALPFRLTRAATLKFVLSSHARNEKTKENKIGQQFIRRSDSQTPLSRQEIRRCKSVPMRRGNRCGSGLRPRSTPIGVTFSSQHEFDSGLHDQSALMSFSAPLTVFGGQLQYYPKSNKTPFEERLITPFRGTGQERMQRPSTAPALTKLLPFSDLKRWSRVCVSIIISHITSGHFVHNIQILFVY